VVKVDLGQGFDATCADSTIVKLGHFRKFLDDEVDKARQMVMVVNKNLKQVFNPDPLVLAQLESLELFLGKFVVMGRVINQGFNYIFQDPDYLFVERCCIP
jgi:hypothetical protein